jgi:hypothetical protein
MTTAARTKAAAQVIGAPTALSVSGGVGVHVVSALRHKTHTFTRKKAARNPGRFSTRALNSIPQHSAATVVIALTMPYQLAEKPITPATSRKLNRPTEAKTRSAIAITRARVLHAIFLLGVF